MKQSPSGGILTAILSFSVVFGMMIQLVETTEYLMSQFTPLNFQTEHNSSWCFNHKSCPVGKFCAPLGRLDGYYSDWLTFGQCLPCEFCVCDNDAIDNNCPLNLCPRGETGGIRLLEGSFFNGQALISSDVCISIFVFEGHTFRQISFTIGGPLYDLLGLYPPDRPVNIEKSQCSELHSGLKSGVFYISLQNEIQFSYTSGYDFQQNASTNLSATVGNDCPNIILLLDRSSLPIRIPVDKLWNASAGALSAYDFFQLEATACGTGPGYCLRPSNYDSLSPLEIRLYRLSEDSDHGEAITEFQGLLAQNAWRAGVSSNFRFFNNGSLCNLVIELSPIARQLSYFRNHIYGCTEMEPSANNPGQSTSTTLKGLSMSTSPTEGKGSMLTASFPVSGFAKTSLINLSTSTTRTSRFPIQSAPTSSVLPVVQTCSNSGDFEFAAGVSESSAFVLNCSEGTISLLHYSASQTRYWTINVAGPIALWFSSLFGIGINVDFLNITSRSLPPSFFTGANSDPTPYILVKKCLYQPSCSQDAQIFTISTFNETFEGPLHVSFTSSVGAVAAGFVLQYAVLASSRRAGSFVPSLRAFKDSLRAFEESDTPEYVSLPKQSDLRASESNQTGETVPVLCQCSTNFNESCPSTFFSDPVCTSAVSTWAWLGYHKKLYLNTVNFSSVDSIVYFERFQNLNANKILYVTASFEIYTHNLPHYLDVLALFKGEDNDPGSCDPFRSFASCSRRSPLSSPPTLQRQLCWAYTSALMNPWGDPHIPDPSSPAYGGSVDFCSGGVETAGPGVYYLLLYSHNLQRIIAQVDYIQSRDCNGLSFPCAPALIPNIYRLFESSGPLSVCPSMFFRSTSVCVPCPAQSWSTVPNSISCFSCSAGKFFPASGLSIDNCTSCPSNLTDSSQYVVSQCASSAVSSNKTVKVSLNVTVSTLYVTTGAAKVCGDGIVNYEASDTGGKQCDSGSSLLFSTSLSRFISIYDLVGSDLSVRMLMKNKYLMCSRQSCQLNSLWCGDGILTSYGPIYDIRLCKISGSKVVCDQQSQLRSATNFTVFYNEQCDDGNTINGDGCSSKCTIESLFRCTVSFGRNFCRKTCGDGVLDVDTGEACDDGNTNNGDGCNYNCQVECGYSCSTDDSSTPSICRPVCGDGIVSDTEECDPRSVVSTPQNPSSDGCSSFCRIKVGWSCNQIALACVLNNSQSQFCTPICGDGLVVSPEQCDDSLWNLNDKACTSNCQINYKSVCYGPECLSPPVSEILPLLERDLILSLFTANQRFSEGIFILQDLIPMPNSVLSRSFMVFPQQYSNISRTFSAISLALANSSYSSGSSIIVTPPFCTRVSNTILNAISGRIAESLQFITNNVSCKYNLQPRLNGQLLNYVVLKMSLSTFELNENSFVQIEASQSGYSQTKLVCTLTSAFKSSNLTKDFFFLSPVTIVIFAVGHSQAELYHPSINFDLRFEAMTEATAQEAVCLSLCQCDVECGRNCFAGSNHQLDTQVKVEGNVIQSKLPSDLLVPQPSFSNLDRISELIFAISTTSESFFGRAAMFPWEFSQYPGASMLTAVSQSNTSKFEVLKGSWRGKCIYRLKNSVSCNVLLQVTNQTVLKHVWNCPIRGVSAGRILSLDSSATIVSDSSFINTFYRNAKIVWTKAGPGDSAGTVTRCMVNSGYSDGLFLESGIQMLFDGSTKNNLNNPKFVGGSFLPDEDCKVLTLASDSSRDSLSLAHSPPLFQPEDVDSFLACNSSLSNAVERLQNESSDCFILVRALLFRDFWSPLNPQILVLNSTYEYEPISRFVCISKCRDKFVRELQDSIIICESGWKSGWTDWTFGVRVFKLLISAVSALYWNRVLCASNYRSVTCASVLSQANTAWSKSQCPPLLPQSLYLPCVPSDQICDSNCSSYLESYVVNMGCCAVTIGEAGNEWLNSLKHPSISSILVDFGDRSNPFNSSLPRSEKQVVAIKLNSNGNLNMLSIGLESAKTVETFVPVNDLFKSTCGLCSLPITIETCCDDMQCVKGQKKYPGSCYCLCSEGFQGASCDLQEYFTEAYVSFQTYQLEFPGLNFSYCQEAIFRQTFEATFGVNVDYLDFQPFAISSSRRQFSKVYSILRIKSISCYEAARMTQKVASVSDQSVSSIFVNKGLLKPQIQSIWTYCDGKRTVCGASTTESSVSQQMVFVACTALIAVNNTKGGGTAAISSANSLPTWLTVMLSFLSVSCCCTLLAAYSCLRRSATFKRGSRKFVQLLQPKFFHRHFAHSREHDGSAKGPKADMVFVQDPDQKEPSQFLILSQFQPQVFELEFLDRYFASEANERETKNEFSKNESLGTSGDSLCQIQNSSISRTLENNVVFDRNAARGKIHTDVTLISDYELRSSLLSGETSNLADLDSKIDINWGLDNLDSDRRSRSTREPRNRSFDVMGRTPRIVPQLNLSKLGQDSSDKLDSGRTVSSDQISLNSSDQVSTINAIIRLGPESPDSVRQPSVRASDVQLIKPENRFDTARSIKQPLVPRLNLNLVKVPSTERAGLALSDSARYSTLGSDRSSETRLDSIRENASYIDRRSDRSDVYWEPNKDEKEEHISKIETNSQSHVPFRNISGTGYNLHRAIQSSLSTPKSKYVSSTGPDSSRQLDVYRRFESDNLNIETSAMPVSPVTSARSTQSLGTGRVGDVQATDIKPTSFSQSVTPRWSAFT